MTTDHIGTTRLGVKHEPGRPKLDKVEMPGELPGLPEENSAASGTLIARMQDVSLRRSSSGGEGCCTAGGQQEGGGRMEHLGIDFSRPSAARVYDHLLGGVDNFQPDRAEARRMLEICPQLKDMALAGRLFTARTVTWAARQGVTQFIDLGAGMPLHRRRDTPPAPEIHQTAQAISPAARVAYVDNDPLVLSHSSALRAAVRRGKAVEPVEGVAVVDADLRNPETVLADRALREVIDPAQPMCVIFDGLVPSLMPAGQAREVVARYAALAAPGSLVALSCWHFADDDLHEQLAGAFTSADLHNHGQDHLAMFLGDLDLIPPGIAPAPGLRPGQPRGALVLAPGLACVLAAVARKP